MYLSVKSLGSITSGLDTRLVFAAPAGELRYGVSRCGVILPCLGSGLDQGVAVEDVLDSHAPVRVVAPAAGNDPGVLQLLRCPGNVVRMDSGELPYGLSRRPAAPAVIGEGSTPPALRWGNV